MKLQDEEQKPHVVEIGLRPATAFLLKREAFITGSQAYGTPSPTSDVDLVIRCSKQTRAMLVKLLAANDEAPFADDPEYGDGCCQFKAGRLNLILCDTDAAFARWAAGTMVLQLQAPVLRTDAVVLFKALGVGKKEASS